MTGGFVRPLLEDTSGKRVGLTIMPEFLREGCAVKDILCSWRVVMGVEDDRSREVVMMLVKRL